MEFLSLERRCLSTWVRIRCFVVLFFSAVRGLRLYRLWVVGFGSCEFIVFVSFVFIFVKRESIF